MVCDRGRVDNVCIGADDASLVPVGQQVLDGGQIVLGADLPLLVQEIERQEDRVLQFGQSSPHLQIEGVS
jgi:hypothetical protein